MWNGRTGRVVVWVLMLALAATAAVAGQSPADWTTGLESRRDQYTPKGRAPVELRFFIKPGAGPQAQRVVAITHDALALFDDWFGPYPYSSLTVIDAPWRSGEVGTPAPGVAVFSTRWLTQTRDMGVERSLIAAIGRQYWLDIPAPEGDWFREALARYSGTRAIHEALEGRNFATYRFFGGVVPFTIRPMLLSPNPTDRRPRLRRFAEVEAATPASARAGIGEGPPRAEHAALALDTLERYLGWPALQQALLEYREHLRAPDGPPVDLRTIVSRQRGRDIGWFFEGAFRAGAHFDYAVADMTSEPADDHSRFRTRVTLRRFGNGIFAGTNEPVGGSLAGARSLPVAVRFEDGTEVRDWLDGRDAEAELSYDSASRALWASVDPEAFLLIDEDRANNTRTLATPFHGTGARLAMNWLLWLQDVMLSYTGLL